MTEWRAGADLGAMRRRAGVSQTQLAGLAGISPSLISAYESGRRTPPAQMAQRLFLELQRPSVILHGHRIELLALAARYGFRNVRVFGSCARGEDTPGSDIDLLVDGADVTLFNISAFAQDASDLMDGIPVDVVVTGTTSPLMDRITSEAVPL